MAKNVIRDVTFLYNEFDLSGDHNSMTMNLSATELECTAFGNNGVARLGGMKSMELSHAGYFSAGAGEVDQVLFDALGDVDSLITVLPNGTSEGNRAYFSRAVSLEYAPLGTVNEVTPFTANAMSQGEKIVGGNLLNFSTETGNDNSTGVQYGAIGVTQSIYAALHVPICTTAGAGLVVTIESDDNSGFSSAKTRATFTTATTATSEWLTPVVGDTGETWSNDDYWRAVWTFDGTTTTFAVSLGLLTIAAT